jgi:hypothetical protein
MNYMHMVCFCWLSLITHTLRGPHKYIRIEGRGPLTALERSRKKTKTSWYYTFFGALAVSSALLPGGFVLRAPINLAGAGRAGAGFGATNAAGLPWRPNKISFRWYDALTSRSTLRDEPAYSTRSCSLARTDLTGGVILTSDGYRASVVTRSSGHPMRVPFLSWGHLLVRTIVFIGEDSSLP